MGELVAWTARRQTVVNNQPPRLLWRQRLLGSVILPAVVLVGCANSGRSVTAAIDDVVPAAAGNDSYSPKKAVTDLPRALHTATTIHSDILIYMDSKITVYSADWCAFCHAAKAYLDKLGVKYTDKNVEHDQKFAQEAIKKSGQMGIPVIDIDGTIVIGFDRSKIDATLHEKNLVK